MSAKHIQKRFTQGKLRLLLPIAFMGIGLSLLYISRAAVYTYLIEPEDGSKSGGVQVINDSSASGGKALLFAKAISPSVSPSATPANNGSFTIPAIPSGYPAVNANGTYFSTLGAPDSALAWRNAPGLLWNKKLPDNSGVATNSSSIVTTIGRLVRDKRFDSTYYPGYSILGYGSHVGFPVNYSDSSPIGISKTGIDLTKYGTNSAMIFLVDSDRETFQPVEGIPGCGTLGWGTVGQNEFNSYINNRYPGKYGIPFPAEFAFPATWVLGGLDTPVTVYDYKRDIAFDFWRFHTTSVSGKSHPTACAAGVIENFSQSSGTYPFPYGARASGTSVLGTMITLNELYSGKINHAIAFATYNVYGTGSRDASFPATRTDGDHYCGNAGSEYAKKVGGAQNCIYEGQRMRLPVGYDISKIKHPLARAMAEAARDYGFIVMDFSGSATAAGEDQAPAMMQSGSVDPVAHYYAAGTQAPWDIYWEFPWDDLQVLPKDFKW